MDQQTRQSIALPVGDRRHDSAKQVWTDLPVAYREQAPLYTDQYAVDLGVMRAAQPQASPQHARTTNYSIARVSRIRCGSVYPVSSGIAWYAPKSSQSSRCSQIRHMP